MSMDQPERQQATLASQSRSFEAERRATSSPRPAEKASPGHVPVEDDADTSPSPDPILQSLVAGFLFQAHAVADLGIDPVRFLAENFQVRRATTQQSAVQAPQNKGKPPTGKDGIVNQAVRFEMPSLHASLTNFAADGRRICSGAGCCRSPSWPRGKTNQRSRSLTTNAPASHGLPCLTITLHQYQLIDWL